MTYSLGGPGYLLEILEGRAENSEDTRVYEARFLPILLQVVLVGYIRYTVTLLV